MALLLAFPGPAAPSPAMQPAPVPLLWKVSDADNSLYLLGSFHLLRKDDYPLAPEVDAAFADAESLLFEIAPSEMASPALATAMGQAALRTDGTRLDADLPEATAARLQVWLDANAATLQSSGLNAQTLQLFEPWFVGLTVSMLGMAELGPQDGHLKDLVARADAALYRAKGNGRNRIETEARGEAAAATA